MCVYCERHARRETNAELAYAAHFVRPVIMLMGNDNEYVVVAVVIVALNATHLYYGCQYF